MADVILPVLSKDVDKAVVSFWHFQIGEDVSKGDDLVEMMTDKATFNVPAPVSGKLINILAEEGQEVKVGDLIATIEESNEATTYGAIANISCKAEFDPPPSNLFQSFSF